MKQKIKKRLEHIQRSIDGEIRAGHRKIEWGKLKKPAGKKKKVHNV